jgi:hypothetical protein
MDLPVRKPDPIRTPEIERLLYQAGVVKMDARGLTSTLTEEQFQWKPSPEFWSVGECFDHLNATNRLWLPLLEEAVERGRAKGLLGEGPFVYGWFSRWLLARTEPPPKSRFRAPSHLRPAGSRPAAEVMGEFVELHGRLESLLRAADGLDLARIRVASPGLRWLRHSLGISFWLLLAHDRRHIYQAREVCKTAGFPRPALERSA